MHLQEYGRTLCNYVFYRERGSERGQKAGPWMVFSSSVTSTQTQLHGTNSIQTRGCRDLREMKNHRKVAS